MSVARRPGLLALLVLSGALLAARSAPGAVSTAAVQTWRVEPGTAGALLEDHRQPLVEVRLVFAGGWWTPGEACGRHAADAFELQLEDPAGRLRAWADRLALDVTLRSDGLTSALALGCRKPDLDSALALARALLGNRSLEAREVARRNRNQTVAWQQNLKDPRFRMRRAVLELLFTARDPRRPAAQPPRPVPTASAPLLAARDTLVRLPGRLIAFAGDLTRAEAERLAAGLLPPALDSLPSAPVPGFLPITTAERRPRAQSVPLERLTQVYMALVREAPGLSDADRPALLVAHHVLAGYFHSRLYEALRHAGGDTYGVGAYWPADTAAGEYGPWTYTRAANADSAAARLRHAMSLFREQGITEEERAAAAGFLRGRRALDAQSPAQVLDRWLWEAARGLEPGFRDRLVERAAALSLDEVNAFIRRFYDPAAFTLVQVVPK